MIKKIITYITIATCNNKHRALEEALVFSSFLRNPDESSRRRCQLGWRSLRLRPSLALLLALLLLSWSHTAASPVAEVHLSSPSPSFFFSIFIGFYSCTDRHFLANYLVATKITKFDVVLYKFEDYCGEESEFVVLDSRFAYYVLMINAGFTAKFDFSCCSG